MTSYYLTDEAERQRIEALALRLRKDILPVANVRTFAPESDFWRLPKSVQDRVGEAISLFES